MIKWYRKIIEKLAEWIQFEYRYYFVDEIPENICQRSIYIVGEKEQPWLIAFRCPCGCNNLIQLNLLKEARPRWNYVVSKKNKITVKPSIWRNVDCRSHFFIRKSKIKWA